MITTNAIEQSTNTDPGAQDTVEAVATIALDEVNGGWMYSPYASAYASPYASAYANPYVAAARYEARLERRAAWIESRAARWWGY